MAPRKSLLVQLVPWTSTSLSVRLVHAVSTEQFTPIQQRAAAALLGAIVGDAAAQTSHWNYDRSAFHAKLRSEGRFQTPEFSDPTASTQSRLAGTRVTETRSSQ